MAQVKTGVLDWNQDTAWPALLPAASLPKGSAATRPGRESCVRVVTSGRRHDSQ
jgi:hypothetical protein